MSIITASRATLDLPENPTLADLTTAIAADATLTNRRRDDITSALRTIAKAIKLPLDQVPAAPRFLNGKLKGFVPAMADLKLARWTNVQSLTRAALKHAGLAHMPGRYVAPLPPAWDALFKLLPNAQARFGLSRFCRYCAAEGIAPDAVDAPTFDRFLQAMETDGLIGEPRKIHRTACKLWNKTAIIPAWPKLIVAVPDYTNTYALPWASFPASLKAEVDRYMERLGGTDILADMDFRPLKPISIAIRKRQLHEFVSATVHGGIDPTRLTSLADLVAMDVVRAALGFLLKRGGGKPSVHAGHIVTLITAIAKHVVNLDDAQLKPLKALGKRVTPAQDGLSDKNRERLRQFDSEASLMAVLRLPERLLAEARRSKQSQAKVALIMQSAILIELLLMVPMRLENLANLTIGTHLIRARNGRMHLILAAHEVKNTNPLEVLLPAETSKLINLYIEKHRPALCKDGSAALFPGRYGGAKSKDMVREQISRCVLTRTGLAMNPHLFRHFAAKVYLEDHTGAYGTVRLLLGHKSVDTTTKYYCGTETAAAFKHVAEHIMHKRDPDQPV